jgi:hypothetical protein
MSLNSVANPSLIDQSDPPSFPYSRAATGGLLQSGGFWFSGFLSLMLLTCWKGLNAWYSKTVSDEPMVWFDERTNAIGWTFRGAETDKAVEGQLAADSVFYGTFTQGDSQKVRVFTAKRFRDDPNEIGLFIHTPDRCWTEAGWRLELADPDSLVLDVDGVRILAERRVFRHPGASRELVYFFGLVGGQPLPYRLDHNLGVGQRFIRQDLLEKSGLALRATDGRMWQRVWDAFRQRRRISGAKQLVRISATIIGDDMAPAEALLQDAVRSLLVSRRLAEADPT